MNPKRRRADDFTDSLCSYRNSTISETNFYRGMLRSFSEDSLEASKKTNGSLSKDSICSGKDSTIIAGSSTKDTLVDDMSTSSMTSRSAMQNVPDLNKRIDLFKNENSHICRNNDIGTNQAYSGINDYKENNDPQYSMALTPMHNDKISKTAKSPVGVFQKTLSCEDEKSLNCGIIIEYSKRDTNYNIQSEATNATSAPKDTVLKEKDAITYSDCDNLLSKLRIADCTNKDSKMEVLNCKGSEDAEEFEALLHSFENHLNERKEELQTQHISQRLSEQYMHSPRNFTEKLIAVIEESVVNKEDDMSNGSAIDLSRLTPEFRKLCKYIEDESVPEWPTSLMSVQGTLEETHLNPACVGDVRKKDCRNKKSLISTFAHISSTDRLKNCRRLYDQLQENSFHNSTDNIHNSILDKYGDTSFEDLEAQCKRLFPNEQGSAQPVKKTVSLPCLLNMSDIRFICEQQMASLNDTDDCDLRNRDFAHACTCTSREKCSCLSTGTPQKLKHQQNQQFHSNKFQKRDQKLKSMQCKDMSDLNQKPRSSNLKLDIPEIGAEEVTDNYTKIDPDEFERTLLQDIIEKRKRCLDTAKLIAEIDADPHVIRAQKSNDMSPKFTDCNELHPVRNNEMKFLNTLVSCKNYYTYLKKQKPLFDYLDTSRLSVAGTAPEECHIKLVDKTIMQQQTLNTKKPLSAKKNFLSSNIKSHGNDKSPSLRKENKGIKGKAPMIFVSPAKSPVKKTYTTPNYKPLYTNKSPASGKSNKGVKEKGCKPRYFYTPGKSPGVNNCRKKRVYFPDMEIHEKKRMEDNIIRSPHAEELFRLNYNTVISPVGMYIRGTDMQLIKNVRTKTTSPRLVPLKKNVKGSPGEMLGQALLSKNINRVKKMSPSKLDLSPKRKVTPKTSDSPNKPNVHFTLPKVSYELPLQVRTIKEPQSPRLGNRVKQLLQSTQSKVVVRHEGRVNTILQKKSTKVSENEELVEINYKPEDESTHIEETATRTNFIQRRKNN